MRYLLCIFLPPLAVLMCGRPFMALINLVLCLLFWLPGVLHAFFVVSDHKKDKRHAEQLREIRNMNR